MVCGLGQIGTRHAKIILNNPNAQLLGIIDIDKKKAKTDLVTQHNLPFYENIRSAFEAQTPDVVCVCTPNGTHAALAMRVLNQNTHVIIEKPMALSATDCALLIAKGLEVKKEIFVVKQNRYSPPSQWLKQTIDSNILGEIYMVQLNCYWNRDDAYYNMAGWRGSLLLDGGPLFTQFSHFIDLLYWVFGDIDNISAKFSNFKHQHNTNFEDSGMVNFNFKNKQTLGCIQYSTANYHQNFESSLTVLAENGTLKIGGQYANEITHCHIKNYTLPEIKPTEPSNDYGGFLGSAANHHLLIENVVNTLNGSETPTANANDGKMVVDIIERIYALKT